MGALIKTGKTIRLLTKKRQVEKSIREFAKGIKRDAKLPLLSGGKGRYIMTKKRKMAVIFGSVDAFALIVAIVVVCCVSHFVGFPECVGVKNTTIRRRKYTSNTTESIFTEKRSCRKANRRQSVLRWFTLTAQSPIIKRIIRLLATGDCVRTRSCLVFLTNTSLRSRVIRTVLTRSRALS